MLFFDLGCCLNFYLSREKIHSKFLTLLLAEIFILRVFTNRTSTWIHESIFPLTKNLEVKMKTEMATKGKEEGRWKNGAFLPFCFMVLLNHCSSLRNLCLSYQKPQTQTWRQRTQWFPVQSGSHVARHCEEGSDVSERASLSPLSAVPDHRPGGRRRRFQLTEGSSGKNGGLIPFSTWCRIRTQNPVLSWVQ